MITVQSESGGAKGFAEAEASEIGYHPQLGLISATAAEERWRARERRGLIADRKEPWAFRFRISLVADAWRVEGRERCQASRIGDRKWRLQTALGEFLIQEGPLPPIPVHSAADEGRGFERALRGIAFAGVLSTLAIWAFGGNHPLPAESTATVPAPIAVILPKPAKRNLVTPPREPTKLASRTVRHAKQGGAAVPANLGFLSLLGSQDLSKAAGGAPSHLANTSAGAGQQGKQGSGGETLIGLGMGLKRTTVGSSGIKGLGGVGTHGAGGGAGGYGTSLAGSGGTGNALHGIGDGRVLAKVPLSKELVLDGGLDKSVIQATIAKYLSQVRACYENGLQQVPGLAGQVTMEFSIGPGGDVRSSKVLRSSLGNAQVEGCIQQRLLTWQFPKPVGGVSVKVSYPFLLRTLAQS